MIFIRKINFCCVIFYIWRYPDCFFVPFFLVFWWLYLVVLHLFVFKAIFLYSTIQEIFHIFILRGKNISIKSFHITILIAIYKYYPIKRIRYVRNVLAIFILNYKLIYYYFFNSCKCIENLFVHWIDYNNFSLYLEIFQWVFCYYYYYCNIDLFSKYSYFK